MLSSKVSWVVKPAIFTTALDPVPSHPETAGAQGQIRVRAHTERQPSCLCSPRDCSSHKALDLLELPFFSTNTIDDKIQRSACTDVAKEFKVHGRVEEEDRVS